MESESKLVAKIARALTAGFASFSKTKLGLDVPASTPKRSSTVHSQPRRAASGKLLRQAVLRLGIGDDAAILAPASGTDWVLTCDAFLEGVHFLAAAHPPESVGYKSLVRATSDLAAMGATPRFFLLTLALPLQITRAATSRRRPALKLAKKSTSSTSLVFLKQGLVGRGSAADTRVLAQGLVGRGFSHDINSAARKGALAPEAPSQNWLSPFLKGMARAAGELGMTIIGGDTTSSDRIFISIAALGEIPRGRALTRSGARPGDLIYVSGKLGRAQLGLELVLRGLARDRRFRALTQPHLYPKIRVALGSWLARHRLHSSAMDLSDGLSTDLARLCAASRAGAKIWADKIPTAAIPAAAAKKLGKRKLDPLQLALHGGEDYELLFTISPRHAKKLRNAPGAAALTRIGEITSSRKIVLVRRDGSQEPLNPGGWDPFRNS